MIKYEWRTSLSPDESAELSDLLGRAAEYDAEPEYNRIDFADVDRAMSAIRFVSAPSGDLDAGRTPPRWVSPTNPIASPG